jgi:hypothetical protein
MNNKIKMKKKKKKQVPTRLACLLRLFSLTFCPGWPQATIFLSSWDYRYEPLCLALTFSILSFDELNFSFHFDSIFR